MKRPLLSLLLGFVLSIAFFGCLSGPGVEPPRVESEDEKNQGGASGSIYDREPVSPGTSSAGAQTASGTGGTTSATGGSGGTGIVMDAAVADGGAPVDSGAVDGRPPASDAELDDDAGPVQ